MAKERDKEMSAKKCYDEWVTKKVALEKERKREEQQRLAERAAQEKEVSLCVTDCYNQIYIYI